MLGPMVNPSFPKNQLVGVFNLELARMYAYLYQNTNTNFTILHSLDGYDEISLTCNTKTITNTMEGMLQPSDFGVARLQQIDIQGGTTIEESAGIFTATFYLEKELKPKTMWFAPMREWQSQL